MARRMTWVGIGLVVAGTVIGVLAFLTDAVCIARTTLGGLSAVYSRFEEALLGGLCSATAILCTSLFLGGIMLLVSGVLKESLPPSS